MKNIFSIFIVLISFSLATAQVGIEREDVRGDGIMDFPGNGDTTFANKGVLVPLVSNTANIPAAGGAIAYNLDSQRMEFYNPSTSGWEKMTLPISDDSNVVVSGPEHKGDKGRFDEQNPDNGTIVEAGTVTGTAPVGVLVLESDDKALILPQVEDATLLPSPEPGMICYDMASDSIAVFNGSKWNFFN